MSFAAVGSWGGSGNSAPTYTNTTAGDLRVLEVINFSNSTVWASSISGGGCTWAAAGVKFSGSTNAFSAAVFLGTVTATGSQTPSITWSGTAPASFGTATQEFSSTAGAWAFDKQGNLDVASGSAWPSLTATFGAGELYFGYSANSGSAAAGSTSGYTYNQNVDTTSDGAAYNPSCPGTATSPAWADSGEIFGIAVLIAEVTSVTRAPQRYGQAAPPSPAPWIQRDRRDANTVGTAANPLAPPLDTAWQADAGYWHLYGDSAIRDRRAYFQQRPLASDPSLLAAVSADPLALNPEQSNSSDMWRVAIVPAFYDRREVPQQRQYYDPSLLATALLENELLGGAGTAQRYGTAAYYDRREVPQQPRRLADPLLIQSAELENELLGGAETAWHAWWWRPGSWPQQRLYISDPSAYPPQNNLDPLLAGEDYLDGHQHQAATHYDRREVPQQRLYISDPSFYPTAAATDPLTVAWGAGGPYWHLYNRAADVADRRLVPQQRAYISDPLLLLSALLENELLGSADDLARHRAWYPDRREYPVLRPGITLPDIPADPLFLGDDRARHALIAGYWPRGWSWFQRLYFPLPAPPPPFTIGALTASDAPSGVLAAAGASSALTAATAASGTLTAADQRTGGPG